MNNTIHDTIHEQYSYFYLKVKTLDVHEPELEALKRKTVETLMNVLKCKDVLRGDYRAFSMCTFSRRRID